MKKVLSLVLLLTGLGVGYAASATTDAARARQMEECFRQHGHLMDKPAVRNVHTRWSAHAYLMDSR